MSEDSWPGNEVPVFITVPTVCYLLRTPKPTMPHHQSPVLVMYKPRGDSDTSGCISWCYHTISKDCQCKECSSHNQVNPKRLCDDTSWLRALGNRKVQWTTSQVAHWVPAALRSPPLKTFIERKIVELLQVSWKTEKWVFLTQQNITHTYNEHTDTHVYIQTHVHIHTHVYR